MKRLFPVAMLASALMLAGCGDIPFLTAGSGSANRPTGQWQKTTIVLQKFNNFLFRDKTSGKLLSPDAAQTLPESQVELEAGDFEELTYDDGRLRYASYGREDAAQPYVVERAIDEAEFEKLDAAIWDDKFFSSDLRNWHKSNRVPMYFLRYNQDGKGHEASYAPALSLKRTNTIMTGYLEQFSGAKPLAEGQKQTVIYLNAIEGSLKVSISTVTGGKDGEAVDEAWVFKRADVDTGNGYQSATIEADGKTFAFTQPAEKDAGAFQLVGLRVEADGVGAYDTLVPIRLK